MRPHSDRYQMTRGDRMKAYEIPWQWKVPSRSYAIVRVDGRSFHGYTKGMDRPFDEVLMAAMDLVGVALCQEISGAQFAYVQSDEVSVLVTDFGAHQEQWFGGKVQKICSVSASVASNSFNMSMLATNHKHTYPGGLSFGQFAQFDARVLTLPSRDEVINYFLWRQADCFINAVTMVAQHFFSDKQLMYKTTTQREEMLGDVEVTMDQYPAGARFGRLVTQKQRLSIVEYTHRKTQERVSTEVLRNYWEPSVAPWFDWDEAGFLQSSIPDRMEDAGE